MIKAELIDFMGDDLRVANAARVSFDKESEWHWAIDENLDYQDRVLSERDTKLIHYLAKHQHFTPFTHPQITLRETVPIFVARQRFKHVVGFTYNEVSRRYVDSEPEFYVPDRWRLAATNVKQGSSDKAIEINNAFRKPDAPDKNSRRSPCTAKFHGWKARVTREGKEFNLTPDDIPWVAKCPILGIDLDWSLGHGEGIKKNSPTLDRIDNALGYIQGNVMVMSSLANTMKSCATPEELKTFARSMLLQYGGEFSGSTNSVSSFYEEMRDLYRRLIASGMCAEQARMFMPQSMMTSYYVTGSLAAFARAYSLRSDPHSQKEIQDLAALWDEVIRPLFPVSWEALTSG